jgi:hypothetical protein
MGNGGHLPASDAALERRLERLGLTGRENDFTDRYLLCEHLVDPPTAKGRQRFEAVARFVRDLIAHRWVKTRQAREEANPKRVYYLSMEFLIGRCLNNNIMNLAAEPLIESALRHEGWDAAELLEEEPDAGLGNGGLGRLAACFLDSLASMQYSAIVRSSATVRARSTRCVSGRRGRRRPSASPSSRMAISRALSSATSRPNH